MAETMLHRLAANNNWTVVILRYFNPYGAHESGLLGEHQKSAHVPNLIEIMTEAALGKRDKLTIYGQSLDTPDGTPIRDFIHIVDLARGHSCALKLFGTNEEHIFNLGTGVGTTVLQAINCFSAVCGMELNVSYDAARVGDPPILIANSDKANAALGWRAEKDFMKMCVDYWKWLKMNPTGYQ
jgi:UDP-glucose 4-epimerase